MPGAGIEMTLQGLSPDDYNQLTLIPGKLYRYIGVTLDRYIPKGEPIHSLPESTSKTFGNIPLTQPFMFLGVAKVISAKRSDPEHQYCWIKVLYKDYLGFVIINTYYLHHVMEAAGNE